MSRASISSARSLSSSSLSSSTSSSASSSPLSVHENDLLLNNNNNKNSNSQNYKSSSKSGSKNKNNTNNNNSNIKDKNNLYDIFSNTNNTNQKFRKDLTRNVFFHSNEKTSIFHRKSTRWRNFWKRKSFLYFIAIGFLIIFINLTLNHDFMHGGFVDLDETARELEENRNFVKHLHSHVPGMKGRVHYI